MLVSKELYDLIKYSELNKFSKILIFSFVGLLIPLILYPMNLPNVNKYLNYTFVIIGSFATFIGFILFLVDMLDKYFPENYSDVKAKKFYIYLGLASGILLSIWLFTPIKLVLFLVLPLLSVGLFLFVGLVAFIHYLNGPTEGYVSPDTPSNISDENEENN